MKVVDYFVVKRNCLVVISFMIFINLFSYKQLFHFSYTLFIQLLHFFATSLKHKCTQSIRIHRQKYNNYFLWAGPLSNSNSPEKWKVICSKTAHLPIPQVPSLLYSMKFHIVRLHGIYCDQRILCVHVQLIFIVNSSM